MGYSGNVRDNSSWWRRWGRSGQIRKFLELEILYIFPVEYIQVLCNATTAKRYSRETTLTNGNVVEPAFETREGNQDEERKHTHSYKAIPPKLGE